MKRLEQTTFILRGKTRTMSSRSGSRPIQLMIQEPLIFWNTLRYVDPRSTLFGIHSSKCLIEAYRKFGQQAYPDVYYLTYAKLQISNFMNAFTSSDHTTYPFATTNPVDYYNLMDVYLDATLSPLLKDADFKQEGWRIGPEDPKNNNS